MVFDFTLINSGADILASEEVEINNRFEDLEFQAVYGYAGVLDSLIIDKELIRFSSMPDDFVGRIQLADPQIQLKVGNSFGVPFGIELQDLEARFKDGSLTPVTLDPGVNPIIIDAPALDQAGQTIYSSTVVDSNNSNINRIASTDLTGIQISVNALGNPTGVLNNFILDTSHLDLDLEVVIPMHLRAEGLELGKTYDFSLGGEEGEGISGEDVKSFEFQLETENGLPLEVDIQIYLLDSMEVMLDSLFNDQNRNILPSGVVNDDGRVIMRTHNNVSIPLSATQIDNLFMTEKIEVVAFVETTDQGTRDIKFYSDNSLGFKLGARAEISVISEGNE
jgi:hypothetical protein